MLLQRDEEPATVDDVRLVVRQHPLVVERHHSSSDVVAVVTVLLMEDNTTRALSTLRRLKYIYPATDERDPCA